MPARKSDKAGIFSLADGLISVAGFRQMTGRLALFLLSLFLLATGASAQTGTIVRVSTTVGDFHIELFDTSTVKTVENFLAYVNGQVIGIDGEPVGADVNYNQTYIHRTQEADSQGIGIIQGGAFRFTPLLGPERIIPSEDIPTVENEPQFSNVRGTIAMAKRAGDPDSATYQWFFNTSDNSNPLDFDNEGFTVFGKVLGGEDGTDLEAGMAVLDTIQGLTKFRPCPGTVACSRADGAPIISDVYGGRPDEELVFVAMEVVDRYSTAVNVFNPSSGMIITSVDADNGTVAYSLKFRVLVVNDQIVLEPRPDTVLLLAESPEQAATFNGSSGSLVFPRIELSESDNLCNLEFQLSDPQALRFTLTGTPEAC